MREAARAGSASDPAESIACRRGASGAACTGTRGGSAVAAGPLAATRAWTGTDRRRRQREGRGLGNQRRAHGDLPTAETERNSRGDLRRRGYFRIQIGSAAKPTAQWLQSLGVTAAVVYYRLPADGWAPVSPFQDGQRAMRLLRAQAASLRVDPERIGALGFSAGGNLAGIVATRFDAPLYPPVDAADQLSARPDFLGMIYPVVSMRAPLDHTRSKRELASQGDAQQAYSVEQHVRKDMPPVFLAQAVDDRTVDVGHSVAMYQATHAPGIPVELHLFEAGGHSWGWASPEHWWRSGRGFCQLGAQPRLPRAAACAAAAARCQRDTRRCSSA